MPRLTPAQEADLVRQERLWSEADRIARAETLDKFSGATFPDALAAGTADEAEAFLEATRLRLYLALQGSHDGQTCTCGACATWREVTRG